MNRFISRMIRAAKLEADLYEEVEADTTALPQAMAVVVLSSLSAGIGAMSLKSEFSLLSLTISSLIAWFIWAYIVYFVGVKILPGPETKSDIGELLRTIGFSSSPGVIRVVGIIPGLYNLVSLVAQIWMLMAMIVAIRQALDYSSTGRAILVCIIGWFIQVLFYMSIFMLFLRPRLG